MPRARAAEPAKTFRVAFSSSTSCTDPDEFGQRLQSLTDRFRPTDENPDFTFFVHLTTAQAGAHGQLGVLQPGGNLSVREIEDTDCHLVLTAMAFIGAVLVDPLVPPPSPLPAPSRRSAGDERRGQAERALTTAQDSRLARFALGVGAGAQGGVAPKLSVDLSLAAEYVFNPDSAYAASVRLALHDARSSAESSVGRANFNWTSARLALCPARWSPFDPLTLKLCGAFDAGRLHAAGQDQLVNRKKDLFWSAAGLSLFVDFLRFGPLSLGAEGTLLRPLLSDSFHFDEAPEQPIHTIPALTGAAGLTLSLAL